MKGLSRAIFQPVLHDFSVLAEKRWTEWRKEPGNDKMSLDRFKELHYDKLSQDTRRIIPKGEVILAKIEEHIQKVKDAHPDFLPELGADGKPHPVWIVHENQKKLILAERLSGEYSSCSVQKRCVNDMAQVNALH